MNYVLHNLLLHNNQAHVRPCPFFLLSQREVGRDTLSPRSSFQVGSLERIRTECIGAWKQPVTGCPFHRQEALNGSQPGPILLSTLLWASQNAQSSAYHKHTEVGIITKALDASHLSLQQRKEGKQWENCSHLWYASSGLLACQPNRIISYVPTSGGSHLNHLPMG